MSSEFHHLSEKVAQLAALTHSLRRENADLRLNLTVLTSQNQELAARIEQAHLRVSTLLETLPTSLPAIDEKETA